MTIAEFEQLVSQALDDLPPEFARAMDNVEVVAEVWPTAEQLSAGSAGPASTLLGLYRGVPQTKRGSYAGALPDKIIIFAGPILSLYGSDPDVVKREVRNTVLHEIGHHFGMSDEEIRASVSRRAG
jgi:predicted Zn-dependent protease with MMP-like domain